MATPAQIIARWDARLKRESAAVRARKTVANDDGPDGYIIVDGEPMGYWLPAGVPLYTPTRKAIA